VWKKVSGHQTVVVKAKGHPPAVVLLQKDYAQMRRAADIARKAQDAELLKAANASWAEYERTGEAVSGREIEARLGMKRKG
jgi:PHD/YefM family antitoxin component YafN of YafNO toxin-antitoxin module